MTTNDGSDAAEHMMAYYLDRETIDVGTVFDGDATIDEAKSVLSTGAIRKRHIDEERTASIA